MRPVTGAMMRLVVEDSGMRSSFHFTFIGKCYPPLQTTPTVKVSNLPLAVIYLWFSLISSLARGQFNNPTSENMRGCELLEQTQTITCSSKSHV